MEQVSFSAPIRNKIILSDRDITLIQKSLELDPEDFYLPLEITVNATHINYEDQHVLWQAVERFWECGSRASYLKINLRQSNLHSEGLKSFLEGIQKLRLHDRLLINFIDFQIREVKGIVARCYVENISFDCEILDNIANEVQDLIKSSNYSLSLIELRRVKACELISLLEIGDIRLNRIEATVTEVTQRLWKLIESKCSELKQLKPDITFNIQPHDRQNRRCRTISIPVPPLVNRRKYEYDCYISLESKLTEEMKERTDSIIDKLDEFKLRKSSEGRNREGIDKSALFVCFLTEEYLEQTKIVDSLIWKEIAYAQRYGSDFIIPIVIDPTLKDNSFRNNFDFHFPDCVRYHLSNTQMINSSIGNLCTLLDDKRRAAFLRNTIVEKDKMDET